MARYTNVNPVEFLEDLFEKVHSESITALSRGGMLLNSDGVLITDDLENEYISRNNLPIVVETEYAQELSWLLMRLCEGLNDVVTSLGKKAFLQEMADAANGCITRGTNLAGLIVGVLARAALMQRSHKKSDMTETREIKPTEIEHVRGREGE